MSALNLNKVVLVGRLTADAEIRQTTDGVAVTTFTLAVNRRRTGENTQPPADFISCVAWRQTAEFITKYFKKGSALCITGSIQTRSWQDSQGQKRYATEVVADEAYFVDSKNESAPPQNAPTVDAYVPDAYLSNSPAAPDAPTFDGAGGDEDLPF